MTDISFAASRLVVGTNTVTFTKGTAGSGFGWDTVLLEVNETTAPAPAQLSGTAVLKSQTSTTRVWTVTVTNTGAGPANLTRMDGFTITQTSGTPGALPRIVGRDPNRFSVPLGTIPPGGTTSIDVQLDLTGTPADAQYAITVPVSANGGSATNTFTGSAAGFPAITLQPVSQTSAAGGTVAFSVETGGTPATYQWFKSGAPISGATSALLILRGLGAGDAGSYTCVATNAAGSATSSAASLSVATTSDPGKLSALSIRGQVGTGGDVMIAGIITAGSTVKTLIQAVGPTLGALSPDLANSVLQNPNLELYQLASGTFVKTQASDDWGVPASGTAAISAAETASGATPLTNPASRDSALLTTLSPGVYTANVNGVGNTTGIVLLQAYAVPSPGDTGTLSALSIRGRVGTGGDVLIAGIIVGGSTSKTLLIQAVGPTLGAISPDLANSVLTDPKLELYQLVNGSFVKIRVNDDWGGDAQIATMETATGATVLPNAASKDSALLVTLPPGVYTANVSGTNNTGGVVLLQAYAVP